MNNSRLKTVALIPAYNEEGSIAKVILRTRQYVDRVIVCDDGSSDMTRNIAEALGARVVSHAERRGKGEALRTLYKEASELGPDILVTLDGDGQHDPDDIPMLLKPIEAGMSSVVIGSRYVTGGKTNASFSRKFGLRVVNFLYKKVAGVTIKDTQSGFRAYSCKALGFLNQFDANGYGVEGEQLMLAVRNGVKVMEVPISIKYDTSGATSKKPAILHGAELISTLLRLIVEEKPLRYLGLPGIGLTLTGMTLGLYLLWMFNITRYFSILVTLLTMGTLIAGLLLIVAAFVLHGLKKINERLRRFAQKDELQ